MKQKALKKLLYHTYIEAASTVLFSAPDQNRTIGRYE